MNFTTRFLIPFFTLCCSMLSVQHLSAKDSVLIPLADARQSLAVIVTPAKPEPDEALAAQEVSTYLEKITGRKFPVAAQAPVGTKTVISIGKSLATSQGVALQRIADAPDGFMIHAEKNNIFLTGTTPQGTLFAAYDFLERLGCRWYMPGELGEVVPRETALAFPESHIEQKPDFAGRHLQSHTQSDPWYRRQKLGGPFFPSAHASEVLLPAKQYFEKNPEYYALVDGKRTPAQLCYTSEEGTRVAAQNLIGYIKTLPAGTPKWVGIGPNDGGGFCRDPGCMALYYEWDPYSNEWSISDAFITWANRIVEIVHKEVPDTKLAFYIYHTYNLPPRKVKPHPAITGSLAPITYCRVHGIRNPVCDEAHAYRYLMDSWSEIMPELYQRGYGFQLASPQFLWSRVHVWRDEVPYAKARGLQGWRVETPPSWANDPVSHWVFCKLMWDAEADVDALVNDFHTNFYGPAAEGGKAFWRTIDTRLRDGDFHAGNAWDEPRFFTPQVMADLKKHLQRAERAAPKESIYAKRVLLLRLAWERAQSFLEMRAAHDVGKFTEAKAALDRYDALTTQLTSYKPPMVEPFMAKRYMDRFWRDSVVSAYERSRGGKRVLAVLPDVWRFRIDPQGVGLMQDWHNTNIHDKNWQGLRTLSGTWSDQGLRTYKGATWYRATVNLPAKHDGKVMLWIGAIDEDATVWVNGKEVGKKPNKDEANPFEFDVTNAIKPGAPNLVAIRAVNNTVDELGTGGLMKVVMFYTMPG